MKNWPLLVSLCCFLIGCKFSYSQEADSRGYIPPSPNAMTFMKYGEYPVDYSTGVPDISIPLYTIDFGDYQFPVTASFHASGRKVSCDFSPLGLNWALNAYGMISREIRGRPDIYYMDSTIMKASYYEPADPENWNDRKESYERKLRLAGEHPDYYSFDGEYDVYTLSINGISAKFIIIGYTVQFLSAVPYKLTRSDQDTFLLTDERGVQYEFKTGELFENGDGISSWLINKITTPKGRKITFTYNSVWVNMVNGISGNIDYTDRMTFGDYLHPLFTLPLNDPSIYSSLMGPINHNVLQQRIYKMAYITAITFDYGSLIFNYSSSGILLTSINIRNAANDLLKAIEFQSGTFSTLSTSPQLPNNNSKTVSAIIFKDRQNTEIERYSFDYYDAADTYTNMMQFGRAKDLWGYYNGRLNNANAGVNIIPINQVVRRDSYSDPVMYTIGNKDRRSVNLASKVGGMIKKIHYPTGGESEFVYENNMYSRAGNSEYGPGIRVKKIISRDTNGGSTTKEYKYGIGENGLGGLAWWPDDNDFYTWQYITPVVRDQTLDPFFNANPYNGEQYRWRVYTSEPVKSLQPAYRLPVYYQQVTEYVYSTDPSQNNGKTVYSYSSVNDTNVEANVIDLPTEDPYFNLVSFMFPDWVKPRLENKTVYKRNAGATPTYTKMSDQHYIHSIYNEKIFTQVWPYRFHRIVTGAMSQEELFEAVERPKMLTGNILYVMEYNLRSAIYKLDEEHLITYDGGSEIETSTIYHYDNPEYLIPTRKEVIKSDGTKETTYTTYPSDYLTGIAFIDDMKANAKHLISYPIEEVTYKESGTAKTILSGTITKYLPGGRGLTDQIMKLETKAPIALSSFKFSNRATGVLPPTGNATAFLPYTGYKTVLEYGNHYDYYGNPSQVTPADGLPTSYLWDYNMQYPIAEVKNSGSEQISYVDVDRNGYVVGNLINSMPIDFEVSTDSEFGYAIDLGYLIGYIWTELDMEANRPYQLVYWDNNSDLEIDNSHTVISSSILQERGDWKLRRIVFKCNSSEQLLFTANNGFIKRLAVYPEDAQMTTYTYDPLVGMTSSTDAAGRTTYYEYDGFGRLQTVSDPEKQPVHRYDYHYQGQ